MKAPAYHLRLNKAADRFALLDAIKRLPLLGTGYLDEYTYISLGGSYLEDFRLLYEWYPEIRMISIEEDIEVYKRQKFHRPFRNLKLVHDGLSSFINQYEGTSKSIFWLDYTELNYGCFQDFGALLETVAENSLIKVTLPSDPKIFVDSNNPSLNLKRAIEFRAMFGRILPDPTIDPPMRSEKLAQLLQNMLQITAEQILPSVAINLTFVPVSSFYYSDGTWMFTLTGIVCRVDQKELVNQSFQNWMFANLTWNEPKKISIPVLSTKERLHLQPLLPTDADAGRALRERLGYFIDDDSSQS